MKSLPIYLCIECVKETIQDQVKGAKPELVWSWIRDNCFVPEGKDPRAQQAITDGFPKNSFVVWIPCLEHEEEK